MVDALAIGTGNLNQDDIPEIYRPDLFPTSRSGIGQDYIDQIMSSIIPQLTSSIGSRDQNINDLTGQSLAQSRSVSGDLISDVLQDTLNNLNARGITNSTITGDIAGEATGNILKNISNQVYQTGIQGASLKLGTPDLLGQLAGLGQVSESQDPSIPQRILASIYSSSQ